jgi:hypothetical protein
VTSEWVLRTSKASWSRCLVRIQPGARRGSEHGSDLGVCRWVVEQTFALPHWFRRLRIRWEIRDDIHEAFLRLACGLLTAPAAASHPIATSASFSSVSSRIASMTCTSSSTRVAPNETAHRMSTVDSQSWRLVAERGPSSIDNARVFSTQRCTNVVTGLLQPPNWSR